MIPDSISIFEFLFDLVGSTFGQLVNVLHELFFLPVIISVIFLAVFIIRRIIHG